MKVLIYSVYGFDRSFLEAYSGNHSVEYTEEHLSIETVGLSKGYRAIATFSSDNVDTSVLRELENNGVKFIATRSVGYNHINIVAAKEYGITVANVPAYSPYSVSEHAVALLLAIVRKVMYAQELFADQDFRLDNLVGFDLYGKNVGIIGCGKIGANFGKIMDGFGCKIMAYDTLPQDNEFIRFVTLEKLLLEADIVYLSCPLNQSTHHIMGRAEIMKMKKEAILINTARGAVIDTEALVELMEEGHLGGAGLDVYEYEKGLYFEDHRNELISAPFFHRLRKLDNIIMTAHQGFLTREALEGIAKVTFANLTQWDKDGISENDIK